MSSENFIPLEGEGIGEDIENYSRSICADVRKSDIFCVFFSLVMIAAVGIMCIGLVMMFQMQGCPIDLSEVYRADNSSFSHNNDVNKSVSLIQHLGACFHPSTGKSVTTFIFMVGGFFVTALCILPFSCYTYFYVRHARYRLSIRRLRDFFYATYPSPEECEMADVSGFGHDWDTDSSPYSFAYETDSSSPSTSPTIPQLHTHTSWLTFGPHAFGDKDV